MKKSFIAVGVASLLGLTSVAQAADVNWYGSIRAGVTSVDNSKNLSEDEGDRTKVTDIAANKGSRIGIKASSDLGNGQSVGGQVEFSIAEPGDDSLNTRRRNVWINGGWGKLTLGKQGGIYRSAANWDQSNYLGGNVRYGGDVDAVEGISYESNLAGPFSFNVEVAGEDGIEQWAATAHYNFGIATLNVGHHDDKRDSAAVKSAEKAIYELVPAVADAADVAVTAITAAITADDADVAAITAAVADVTAAAASGVVRLKEDTGTEKVAAKNYYDNTVISVNGSAGGFDWYLAYERSTRTDGTGLPDRKASTFGAFAGYDVTENDKVYAEYEKGKLRDSGDEADSRDAFLVGYSHNFGGGLNFSGEYVTKKNVDHKKNAKSNTLALVLKYGF